MPDEIISDRETMKTEIAGRRGCLIRSAALVLNMLLTIGMGLHWMLYYTECVYKECPPSSTMYGTLVGMGLMALMVNGLLFLASPACAYLSRLMAAPLTSMAARYTRWQEAVLNQAVDRELRRREQRRPR